MKRNIGTLDALVRLAIGLLLLYIGFFNNPLIEGGVSKLILGGLAFIPLATGLLRFCPLYLLIGADTTTNESGSGR